MEIEKVKVEPSLDVKPLRQDGIQLMVKISKKESLFNQIMECHIPPDVYNIIRFS